MTRRRSSSSASPHHRTIARKEAAQLIRSARASCGQPEADAIEWALAAIPDHPRVQQLAIRHALMTGQQSSADVLIMRGLLMHPADPTFSLLRAERLMDQNDLVAAKQELRLAREQRPHHIATTIAAARLARLRGNLPNAIQILGELLMVRPNRDDLREQLVELLLEVGEADRAAGVLHDMTGPTALLTAGVLRAQQRWLEAIDALQQERDAILNRADSAHVASTDADDCAAITCAMIDLLEAAGLSKRLRALLDMCDHESPQVQIEVARAQLGLGPGLFRQVIWRMAPLRHIPEACGLIVVALAALGRLRGAERALRRMNKTHRPPPPAHMAELWRRAIAARLISDQTSALRPRGAGADRTSSMLQPMLRRANKVLQRRIKAINGPFRSDERMQLLRERAVILEVLGRAAEAATLRAEVAAHTAPLRSAA